jgi:hypothetical protein
VYTREQRSKSDAARAVLFSSDRKESPECAIIRAQRSRCFRGTVVFVFVIVVVVVAAAAAAAVTLVLVVVTAVPRYDNFTFIDRSKRTSLYLPFHPFPRTLSFRPFLSFPFLSVSLTLGQSFFFLARSLSRSLLARFLFTVLVV